MQNILSAKKNQLQLRRRSSSNLFPYKTSAKCTVFPRSAKFWQIKIAIPTSSNKKNIIYLEPVGSVAPKINSLEHMRVPRISIGQNFNIIANIQGFPVPSYL